MKNTTKKINGLEKNFSVNLRNIETKRTSRHTFDIGYQILVDKNTGDYKVVTRFINQKANNHKLSEEDIALCKDIFESNIEDRKYCELPDIDFLTDDPMKHYNITHDLLSCYPDFGRCFDLAIREVNSKGYIHEMDDYIDATAIAEFEPPMQPTRTY